MRENYNRTPFGSPALSRQTVSNFSGPIATVSSGGTYLPEILSNGSSYFLILSDIRVMSRFRAPNTRKHQTLTRNNSNNLREFNCLVFSLILGCFGIFCKKIVRKNA
jgi:hypothetical protein